MCSSKSNLRHGHRCKALYLVDIWRPEVFVDDIAKVIANLEQNYVHSDR